MDASLAAELPSRSIVTSPGWATEELGERWVEPPSNNDYDHGALSSHNGTGQATFVTADDDSVSSHRLTNPNLPDSPRNDSGEANGTFKLNDSADVQKVPWTEAISRDLFTPSKLEQMFTNPPPSASTLHLPASQVLENIAEESERHETDPTASDIFELNQNETREYQSQLKNAKIKTFDRNEVLENEAQGHSKEVKGTEVRTADQTEHEHHVRLFNPSFDTYTRQHLSAIVTELDVEDFADETSRSSKRLRLGPLSPKWKRHFGRRRSSSDNGRKRGRLGLGAARRVFPQETNEITTQDFLQQAEDLMQAIRGASSGSPNQETTTSLAESHDGGSADNDSDNDALADQNPAASPLPKEQEPQIKPSDASPNTELQLRNSVALRTISASTVASTASGASSSANMTKIMPDDIPNLPDTVGYMTFDKANMRWIRVRGSRSRAATNGEDSQESDDPFRSIESDERNSARKSRVELSAQSNKSKSRSIGSKANASETPRKHSFNLEKESPSKVSASDAAAATPANPPNKRLHDALLQKEPRSVSFADGRRAGKMVSLEHIAFSPIRNPKGATLFSGVPLEGKTVITSTPAPMSTRTKRINEAFESLDDLGQETIPPTPAPLRDMSNNFEFESRPSIARSRLNQTFLTECSFGVATDDVVRLITDIEPYEPNWDAMKEIDISDKYVDNLVRLKEFLPNLEIVKAGNNSISYLTGLPLGVKSLHVANNKLTSLTSYRELHNLQFLDISGNNIDSLVGLEVLPHLREVNADNNALTACEGIMNLNALLRLSLRNNRITELAFAGWKTHGLEVLNVSKNAIRTVTSVSSLQNLMLLNLDNNELEAFEIDTMMPRMKNLRVSANKLKSLDIKHLPNLRLLYVDENEICDIQNSHKAHKMDSFSIRDQRNSEHLQMSQFRDARKMFIGGNKMPRFSIKIDFLALQYLELAMAQINELPADMARRVPNIRTLNLCHNLLIDVTPLSGLGRLTHLHLVSNRISDARRLSKVVETLSELWMIDLRANPMTSHMYPTIPIKTEKSTRSNLYNYAVNVTSHDVEAWTKLDILYRRSLSDEWYVRRLAYRGVLMESQKSLKWIDGTKISAIEREKAAHVVEIITRRPNAWTQLLGNSDTVQ